MYVAKKIMQSKVGELRLYASDAGLAAIVWENQTIELCARIDNEHPILITAERQLKEYFAGCRREFDLPLDFCIGTDFQRQVWNTLRTIPYAQTCSYGAIAKQIGNERAVRAVGAANGKNPIPIIVPCHRVIGASGTLVGFAGGLETKKILLDHEFSHAFSPRQLVHN